MEERVFINIGAAYYEVIHCFLADEVRFYAYATTRGGISVRRECGYYTKSAILRESGVEAHAIAEYGSTSPRVAYIRDINPSVSTSKYGSLEELSEAVYRYSFAGFREHTSGRILSFLKSLCDYTFYNETAIKTREVLNTLLDAYLPEAGEGSNISIYLNAKDHKRGRRTTMKAGRVFRHIFREAPDKVIAKLTEEYIEWSSPRVFSLRTGYKAEDFAIAYDGETAGYRNPKVTCINKSLATSCMQGVGRDYRGEYYSVGEAYASGDFHIAWLEAENGKIAGRVVIGYREEDDAFVSGPVYGSCEQSLVMLNEYLHGIRATDSDCEGWLGLRLKVVGCPSDPIVPYIDGDYSGDVILDKYIELNWSGHGSIGFENTNGYASSTQCCDSCETAVREEEAYHSPYTGETLCECCFSERYVYTEDGDVISVEYSVQALTYSHWRNTEWSVTVHIADTRYIESLDQTWLTGDVNWCNEREEYYPSHLLEAEKELAA
jgi:hypothetical protein